MVNLELTDTEAQYLIELTGEVGGHNCPLRRLNTSIREKLEVLGFDFYEDEGGNTTYPFGTAGSLTADENYDAPWLHKEDHNDD